MAVHIRFQVSFHRSIAYFQEFSSVILSLQQPYHSQIFPIHIDSPLYTRILTHVSHINILSAYLTPLCPRQIYRPLHYI